MQSQVEVIYISSEEDDAWKYVLTPTYGLSDPEIMEDQVDANGFAVVPVVPVVPEVPEVPVVPEVPEVSVVPVEEIYLEDDTGSVVCSTDEAAYVIWDNNPNRLESVRIEKLRLSKDNEQTFQFFVPQDVHNLRLGDCDYAGENLFKEKTNIMSFCAKHCEHCQILLKYSDTHPTPSADQLEKAFRTCNLSCLEFPDSSIPRTHSQRAQVQMDANIDTLQSVLSLSDFSSEDVDN